MQIMKTVKKLMKEIQRLRKILKCCSIKTLQQFLENFDIPLINCKVSLTLTWSENCILTDITTQAARNGNPCPDPPVQVRESIDTPTGATFQITDIKLYVPVVTLSTKNCKKLLEHLRVGFKRTIKWNKYRSEITNQTENNSLNYLIDPAFTKVNRFLVLSF